MNDTYINIVIKAIYKADDGLGEITKMKRENKRWVTHRRKERNRYRDLLRFAD